MLAPKRPQRAIGINPSEPNILPSIRALQQQFILVLDRAVQEMFVFAA
jgi:hypothetical protein